MRRSPGIPSIAAVLLSTAMSTAPASAQPATRQIVLRVADGGAKPDQFCMPAWSFTNETGADIGALLVQVEWRKRSGEVLQPVGQFGTMIERFTAGKKKDMFANGHPAACRDLQIVVRTYACRDAQAVRTPCPGPLVVQATGGVSADTKELREGPMRGAVEAR